jgi:hypothetical protein
MRTHLGNRVVALFAILILPSLLLAQNAPAAKQAAAAKPSAPAPKQDISGVWFHQGAGSRTNKTAPLTAWGKAQMATHKTNGQGLVANSTDPMVKCDPLGFPRNVTWEDRGIQFVTSPAKTVELFQYQRIWREIWTDGRALPKNAGSDAINAPDPRYYGYSIGRWQDDNTFIVETNDTNEDTWLDNNGDPHSNELKVTEAYHRPDHDHMQITVNIDDPKAYTQPFVLGTVDYTWNSQQEFEEQLCIPSDAQAYMSFIAGPAGAKK